MMRLCIEPPKNRFKAYAIAHAQVTDSDPLRFFVTNSQQLIVNPVITRHTQVPIESYEQCTSFDKERPTTKLHRYHKCEITYCIVEYGSDPEMTEVSVSVSGLEAKIFQHEIDHMDGLYVYDKTIV